MSGQFRKNLQKHFPFMKMVMLSGMNEAMLRISVEEFIQGMEAILNRLKADGLDGEDDFYRVYMGETELGSFKGKELSNGINLAFLETHPLQETARKLDDIREEDILYRNWNRRNWRSKEQLGSGL